jgi:hypothetical protein
MSSQFIVSAQRDDSALEPPHVVGRLLGLGAAGIAALGLLLRLAPLLNADGRLLRQFPTEDGYLMLTLARNLAIGKGLSVADGLIPSNGTQPLATLIWSGLFWLAGGDRELGVGLVQGMEIVFAALTAWLLARLGERLLGSGAIESKVSWLVAAVWLASPIVVPHSMNCLETGVYGLFVVSAALAFVKWSQQAAPWPLARIVGMGGIIGGAFWARNDAIFLGAAVGLAHVALPHGVARTRRMLEVVGFGVTGALLAAPWMIFNYTRFGSIVPISGHSETIGIQIARNLRVLAVVWAEYFAMLLPLPASFEEKSWFALLMLVLVGTALTLLVGRTYRVAPQAARRLILAAGFYASVLTLFYGLSFGAPHFLSRYLFPISPFIALLWGGALLALLRRSDRQRVRGLTIAALLALALPCLAMGLRAYSKGNRHQHMQVVSWVRENVPPTSWVAAPQTGTLGFFYDRALNLDGKVNPEALAWRQENKTLEYAVFKKVDYIADWASLAHWALEPALAPHYDLLVHDEALDLMVLRRKGAPLLRDQAAGRRE